MVDLDKVSHHPAIEEIVDTICASLGSDDRHFFRVITAFYLCTTAAAMRVNIATTEQELPVNSYAITLGESGTGKGFSTGMLENGFLAGFRDRFTTETMPTIAERNLNILAQQRSARNGTDSEDELAGLEKDYQSKGSYLYSFDGGHEGTVKQLREKLLLANCGCLNLLIDEIGLKFSQGHIQESMTLFLELYDQGLAKPKLLKNGSDNKRTEEIFGKTPANSLWFGSPTKVLDGGKVEDAFYGMLDTGYARRSLFAYGKPFEAVDMPTMESVKEFVAQKTSPQQKQMIAKWATHFTSLADPDKHNWLIDVPDDLYLEMMFYRKTCEYNASKLPKFDSIKRAEMIHRYFKTIKLAGAFAFIDESIVMTKDHFYAAMKLVEESGVAFQALLNRERDYMKLARHIADIDTDATHADLVHALPFYPKSAAPRNDIMSLAVAWGYKNNIIIRKNFSDGIEFFSGESLQEVDLEAVSLSYSNHYAFGYLSDTAAFDDLPVLTQMEDYHFCTHAFEGEHRAEDNVIPGFDLLVVDVDGTADLDQTHELLKDFTFMTYTTKRHTSQEHRFRLIFPMNYRLHLDREDFALFVQNFLKWLPIQVDEAAMQRSRKWATNHNGKHHINHGQLIDVLPFIPKTSRNEEFHERNKSLHSLDNLERWFAQRMVSGDRNNQMIKFALALIDSGFSHSSVEQAVRSFNSKLDDKLSPTELDTTVLVTVARKFNAAAA